MASDRDPGLQLAGITMTFGATTVVRDVDLDVAPGSIVALLGPSGCGKTTLLRVIAGLETPTAGRVRWRGGDLTTVRPARRPVGLMFQDDVLFPHRDVGENVAFGLKMAKVAPAARRRRVADLLELVGLPGTESRPVARLSGGEAQRVALARALAPEPELLLLDEPLGSLDRARRDHLVTEIRRIVARLGLTAIHVTHDHDEAFSIADRVAVMDAGRILQVDAPDALLRSPATRGVARFLDAGTVVDTPGALTALGLAPDTALLIGADALRVDAAGEVAATARWCRFRGGHYLVGAELRDGTLVQAHSDLRVGEDQPVMLSVDARRLRSAPPT